MVQVQPREIKACRCGGKRPDCLQCMGTGRTISSHEHKWRLIGDRYKCEVCPKSVLAAIERGPAAA